MNRKFQGLWLALMLASLPVQVMAAPSQGKEDEAGREFRGRRFEAGPREGGPRLGGRNSKFRLSRWLEGVSQLESGKTALSKVQAQKVVGIMRPWRARKTMSEAEAKTVYTQLSAVLTASQKQQVESFRGNRPLRGDGAGPDRPPFEGRPPGDRPDGPPPGGFGGPGPRRDGGGRGGEGRPGMEEMRTFLTTFNPLASPKLNSGYSRLPERMQEMLVGRFRETDATVTRLGRKAK